MLMFARHHGGMTRRAMLVRGALSFAGTVILSNLLPGCQPRSNEPWSDGTLWTDATGWSE